MHAFVGHVLLGQYLRQLLRAVVAEVDEDNDVALLYGAVNGRVVDRLDEFVGHSLGIAFLHGLHHVVGLLALALYEQVVSLFYTIPTLVAVHGVEASHNACHVRSALCAYVFKLLDEARAALRVGVAAVHEAVNVGFLQAVFL